MYLSLLLVASHMALVTGSPLLTFEDTDPTTGVAVTCDRCPPGSYLRARCSSTQKSDCAQCPQGSFTEVWNHMPKCRRCSVCGRNQAVKSECTASRDCQCQCQPGYYFRKDDDMCVRHGEYPSGQGVLTAGSEVIRVSEGSDVILPCSLKESVVQHLFDWRKDGQKKKEEVFMYHAGLHYNNGQHGQDDQFRGRVSHFEDQLKFGNASIKIINTKITDSGDYTCVFPRLVPRQTFNIKLVVGSVPKPTVRIFNVTDSGVQLKCEVQGAFPKPELRWQDSDGNILDAEEAEISERDGRYDISLQTTVTSTRTSCFQCVVQQKDLNHETGSNITVSEKLFVKPFGKDSNVWMITAVTLGVLLLAVVPVLLVLMWIRGKKKDDDPETKKPLSSTTITV